MLRTSWHRMPLARTARSIDDKQTGDDALFPIQKGFIHGFTRVTCVVLSVPLCTCASYPRICLEG